MNLKNEAQYMADVKKTLDFFESNYFRNIKFSDVMSVVDIGECNFKKYFKKATGKSVIHYFKWYKIQKAKELIDNGGFTFTEISLLLGYDSIHYFSRQFKTVEGISPTEYKIKRMVNK